MTPNVSQTDVMLSILHLDRGINFTSHLEVILKNLQENPEEFNTKTALKLIDVTKSIRGCFHDCYSNHLYSDNDFDNLYELVNDLMVGRD